MTDYLNRESQEALRKRLALPQRKPDTLADVAKAWFLLFALGTIVMVVALLRR